MGTRWRRDDYGVNVRQGVGQAIEGPYARECTLGQIDCFAPLVDSDDLIDVSKLVKNSQVPRPPVTAPDNTDAHESLPPVLAPVKQYRATNPRAIDDVIVTVSVHIVRKPTQSLLTYNSAQKYRSCNIAPLRVSMPPQRCRRAAVTVER